MSARDVALSNGGIALVSECDFDRVLSVGKWFAIQKGPLSYVCRSFGRDNRVYLHRFIMSADSGLVVDHINGNTFDNRQENLRVVNQGRNVRNRAGAQSNSKTGVRGVHPFRDKYEACARLDGKAIYLGVFASIEDAAIARRVWEERNWSTEDRYRAMIAASQEPTP